MSKPKHKAHDALLVNHQEPIGGNEQVSNPNTTVGGYGHARDGADKNDKDTQKNSNDALGEKRASEK